MALPRCDTGPHADLKRLIRSVTVVGDVMQGLLAAAQVPEQEPPGPDAHRLSIQAAATAGFVGARGPTASSAAKAPDCGCINCVVKSPGSCCRLPVAATTKLPQTSVPAMPQVLRCCTAVQAITSAHTPGTTCDQNQTGQRRHDADAPPTSTKRPTAAPRWPAAHPGQRRPDASNGNRSTGGQQAGETVWPQHLGPARNTAALPRQAAKPSGWQPLPQQAAGAR